MKNTYMPKLFFYILIGVSISCSPSNKSSSTPKEEELYITRKYVGNFVDYKYTGPVSFGGPHIIYIKTTLDTTYSQISAYSAKCEFAVGDKLYLRRTYSASGGFGYWFYQIENDSSVFYKISEFLDDDKILVQSWF
jgi:hypothetical protein